MRLTLIAVGRAKAGPAKELFDLYQKRLGNGRSGAGWSLSLKEVEEKKNLPAGQLKRREGELLLSVVPKGALIITLDERGKELTSQSFSERMSRWQDDGHQDVCFLIGGADGLDDAVRAKADFSICFGRMTWPHMLVRGLLAEQLYRASCIASGHPYHRE
ncbi:23S rRNA (pseudouridine(1915)-N(3))-methyltransferase RlmH [Kiloniella sp. b19]|uniref:23S rRNA (pseudouridine(1915)-N(3))-methyltransferase RlmH n=1 Tax=Kiloniella sp. GXU_MW_B19 TaxID=3141326 RepID=UPI0031D7D1F3